MLRLLRLISVGKQFKARSTTLLGSKNNYTKSMSSKETKNDGNNSVRPSLKRSKLSPTDRILEMLEDKESFKHASDISSAEKDKTMDSCNIDINEKAMPVEPLSYDPSNPRSAKNMSYIKDTSTEKITTFNNSGMELIDIRFELTFWSKYIYWDNPFK